MILIKKYLVAAVLISSVALSACSTATDPTDPHEGHHAMPSPASRDASLFTQANQQMMMDMHATELTGDVDYDFVMGMIPHHQGAIDMAAQLLESDKVADVLRPLAEDIIAAQLNEISFMKAWLASYGAARPSDNAEQIIAAYSAINAQMMSDMSLATSGDVNRDFVNGMIPHHEAAVAMAKVLLQFSHDPALIKMANAVIREQAREIELMQQY
ncbi:DUF305 domain-containing protein [Marinomonas sp. M1K-6]|uniref:DUF305 domain-containing protein n=1 Tax=Marinomonas profundi TaxID=2726122 RepID=A0A847QXM1_9GAMM|nr:DUF305 domain-containing protein [Marinomonas profundi]NLQ18518.1 DUF305 domain-containing protein [Marinomonas profundi]UDV04391.1 DUF305 domain-containing protein [Marinomonas profundi]